MDLSIPVNFQSTSNLLEADRWLRELESHPILALDFETADLAHFQSIIDSPDSSHLAKRQAQACLRATALDHPSHVTITHLSVAWSESDAYVFIINSTKLLNRILTWLTTTTVKQVWHNFSYDGKLIHHFTGKFPHDVEDSSPSVSSTTLKPTKLVLASKSLLDSGTEIGPYLLTLSIFLSSSTLTFSAMLLLTPVPHSNSGHLSNHT